LYEISQILNCGIDRSTLSILVSLCENGVNPEALALVIKELRRESEALKVTFKKLISFHIKFLFAIESRENMKHFPIFKKNYKLIYIF